MSGPPGAADLRQIDVVAPNLNRRYSGVTATVMALLPHQARDLRIAALGHHIPAEIPRVAWSQILRHGWSPPPPRHARIWHARRNIEMLAGILLRDLLRQPWKLIFTSAAQRRHTGYTRWLIRRMDALIATSPQAAGFLERPATVIMHGVDLNRFAPAPDRASSWAATGLPGRHAVGVFGRIRHQKGTDLFAEAMIRLLPKHPDWTAVVIGLATPDNAEFLSAIKARVAEAGLSDRLAFLGELPATEIPGWFARLTVHAAPQRWEGFGLTPLESMASGTAVVATRAGVFASLVEHGVSGLLVETGNLEALTAALDEVMSDPARAEAMGREGRARAERNFAIKEEAARIAAVYEELWREAQ